MVLCDLRTEVLYRRPVGADTEPQAQAWQWLRPQGWLKVWIL